MTTAQRMILGFIAAAISVLIFHQGMILLLREIGMLPAAVRVWNLTPNPFGVPQVLNLCFWGGLYGVAFGLLAPRFRLPMVVCGLLTGVAAMLVGKRDPTSARVTQASCTWPSAPSPSPSFNSASGAIGPSGLAENASRYARAAFAVSPVFDRASPRR